MTGTVAKWFEEKGFGFIRQDDRGPDLFVHWSALASSGRRSLYVGERTEFEPEETERGWRAVRVVLLPDGAEAGAEQDAGAPGRPAKTLLSNLPEVLSGNI